MGGTIPPRSVLSTNWIVCGCSKWLMWRSGELLKITRRHQPRDDGKGWARALVAQQRVKKTSSPEFGGACLVAKLPRPEGASGSISGGLASCQGCPVPQATRGG